MNDFRGSKCLHDSNLFPLQPANLTEIPTVCSCFESSESGRRLWTCSFVICKRCSQTPGDTMAQSKNMLFIWDLFELGSSIHEKANKALLPSTTREEGIFFMLLNTSCIAHPCPPNLSLVLLTSPILLHVLPSLLPLPHLFPTPPKLQYYLFI